MTNLSNSYMCKLAAARAPHCWTVLQDRQNKTPNISWQGRSIMKYLPRLSHDTNPLSSSSGDRAKMLLKNKKGEVFYCQESTRGKLSTTFSNAAEVAQWATSSCSRPPPATANSVRDGRSNWLAVTPTLMASTPERLMLRVNRCSRCRE